MDETGFEQNHRLHHPVDRKWPVVGGSILNMHDLNSENPRNQARQSNCSSPPLKLVLLSLAIVDATARIGVCNAGETLAVPTVQGELAGRTLSGRYVVAGDVTVNNGTVTVRPGTTLEFPSATTWSVGINGQMLAIGSAAAPITFKSRLPNTQWPGITIVTADGNGVPYVEKRSSFEHCLFQSASNAVYLQIYVLNGRPEMTSSFRYCRFEDCGTAIRGHSEGIYLGGLNGQRWGYPVLRPEISSCVFLRCGNGVKIDLTGSARSSGSVGAGSCSPQVAESVFVDVSDAALSVVRLQNAGNESIPSFCGNLVLNSQNVIVAPTGVDAVVEYNVAYNTPVLVERGGAGTTKVIGNVVWSSGNTPRSFFRGSGFPVNHHYGDISLGTKWGRWNNDIYGNVFVDDLELDRLALLLPKSGLLGTEKRVLFGWKLDVSHDDQVYSGPSIDGPWTLEPNFGWRSLSNPVRVLGIVAASTPGKFYKFKSN